MKVEARTVARFLLRGMFVLLWVGGVVSYLFLSGPPADAGWAAPAFLLVAAALVLFDATPRGRLALALCGGLGFGAEVLGVSTGWPFGAYAYTAALAPSVWGVPFALAAAWIIVAAVACQAASRFGSASLRILLGALLMVAIDLLLDPVAAGPLGYWRWQTAGAYYGIPLTNFAGWLAVGLVLMGLLESLGARMPGSARGVGIAVVLFFTVLAASFGLTVPALVGLAVLAPLGASIRFFQR